MSTIKSKYGYLYETDWMSILYIGKKKKIMKLKIVFNEEESRTQLKNY